jgi:hypothetical protein
MVNIGRETLRSARLSGRRPVNADNFNQAVFPTI